MNFQCPHCQTGYRIDDARIPGQGVQTRCKECKASFFLTPQGVRTGKAAAESSPSQPAAESPARKPAAGPPPPEAAAGTSSPELESETAPGPAGVNLTELGNRLDASLAAGKEDAAAATLLAMITSLAHNRQFVEAEALRDRMYEDTPMAITEIQKAGDLIEEQKFQAMDQGHLERWDRLYAGLSSEETSALYFSMIEMTLGKGESVYRQGRVDGYLCLVEEGGLKLTCTAPGGDEEITIREVRAGDIVGVELFFSFTVATFSAVVNDVCKLKLIDRPQRFKWMAELPGLISKLQTHCDTLEKLSNVVVQKGIERREANRLPSKLPASLRILDEDGKPQDPSIGLNFADVCTGGACLDVKLSTPEEAKVLLGAWVTIDFSLPAAGAEIPLSLQARVVAVHFHAFGDCSMHIHLREPLNDKAVELIAA